MIVLSFSYCFPSVVRPAWGVFVESRLAALAAIVDVEVVSPVPMFPLLTHSRGGTAQSGKQSGLTVHRPTFFYLPAVLQSLHPWFYARGLSRWFADHSGRRRPDVLDSHFIWPDGVGVGLLARQWDVPYAITLRGKLYPCLENRRMRRRCAEALCRAAAVISVSRPLANLARELGAPDDRVSLIPNGVDTEHFRPRDKQAAKQQLGLGGEGPLLVSVGHIGRRKGHHEVIEALSRLDDSIRLVLVGGDRSGGTDMRALRRCIDRCGMGRRVVLVGERPHEEIPLFFAAADASVLASYREGCPNAVLESLACGRPVIATDVGAVPDQIQDERNGRIVPVRDPSALAEAIDQVLGREWDAEEVRSSPAVCSWTEVGRRHAQALREAIER